MYGCSRRGRKRKRHPSGRWNGATRVGVIPAGDSGTHFGLRKWWRAGLFTATRLSPSPPMRCFVLLFAFLPLVAVAAEEAVLKDYLEQHCTRCHGEKKQKGELRLDALSRDFANSAAAMRWGDVIDRISTGEMPPEEEPQPKTEENTRVVEWLTSRLKEGEASRLARRERVTFHKLTREEYANTIYDLLGVHYDATDPTGLPEDPNWQGFERIGSVLSLSPAHVEKYFAAAEAALAEALPAAPVKPLNTRWTPFDFRGIR